MFVLHLLGAFCLGEIVGRRNIIGYDVKDVMWDVHEAQHHKQEYEIAKKKAQEKGLPPPPAPHH